MPATPTRPPVKIPDDLLKRTREVLELPDAPYGVVIRAALIRITGMDLDPWLKAGRPSKK